jgi:hypothetical protein
MIRLRRGSTNNLEQTGIGNPWSQRSIGVLRGLRLKKFYPNSLKAPNQIDEENEQPLDLNNNNFGNDYDGINDLFQVINDIEDNLLDTNNENQVEKLNSGNIIMERLVQNVINNLLNSVDEKPENSNIENVDVSSTEIGQPKESTVINHLIQDMHDYILQNPTVHKDAREGIKAHSLCGSSTNNKYMRLKKGSLWYATCKDPSNNILENTASELSNDILNESKNKDADSKKSFLWLTLPPQKVASEIPVTNSAGTLSEQPSKTFIGNPKQQTNSFTRYNMLRLKTFFPSYKNNNYGFLGSPKHLRSAFPGYKMLRLKKFFPSYKNNNYGFLGSPKHLRSAFPGYKMLRLKKSLTKNSMVSGYDLCIVVCRYPL